MHEMLNVVIPFALLLIVVLCRFIPFIGGSVKWGLVVGATSSLLMGGVFEPMQWVTAFINGLDKLSWVIALALVGSIYAETQVRIGTMQTVLDSCRARFGRTPRGLVVVVLFVLCLSGSLLGESIASAVVIGVLVLKNLDELEMSPEQICATIVMGCCMGSIMPPITQASIMAAGLLNLSPEDADSVVNWTYITVGTSFLIISVFVSFCFVKIKQIPEHLISKKKASQILIENWKSLVPISVLSAIIILRSGFGIDVLVYLDPIFAPIKDIPVIKGFNYTVNRALYITILVSLLYKPIRQDLGPIVVKGIKNVMPSVSVQVCAAFLVGAFYMGGQVKLVEAFASTLGANFLKVGGSIAMAMMGMITGSQTAVQTTIFTFFGPALVESGVSGVNAAVAGGHLAMAGQGLPPADVVTFVVAGLVATTLGKDVNIMKSMKYSMSLCACFITVAFIFMYM